MTTPDEEIQSAPGQQKYPSQPYGDDHKNDEMDSALHH
jgi:hypothetical protein